MPRATEVGRLALIPPMRRYRRWLVVFVAFLLVGSGVTAWRLEASSGVYTGGLSANQPSALQLSTMADWYQRHYAQRFFAGTAGRFGCIVYPMATQWVPAGQTAYTEVMCQQCPPSHLGGLTPVVFRLDGSAVKYARAVDAVGYPGVLDQIRQYFPRQLWNEASSPRISYSDTLLLMAAAYQVAGWWPMTGKCSTAHTTRLMQAPTSTRTLNGSPTSRATPMPATTR